MDNQLEVSEENCSLSILNSVLIHKNYNKKGKPSITCAFVTHKSKLVVIKNYGFHQK